MSRDLVYYRAEEERHPVAHKVIASKGEAAIAVRRLWLHFAGRKAMRILLDGEVRRTPIVEFTSGNRNSAAFGTHRIVFNVGHLSWLLICHEVAHALDDLRRRQGRRAERHIHHGKHHARWTDRLVAYVSELGWTRGELAHEIAMAEIAEAERVRKAACGPSLEQRIERRREQVARLEKKIRALTTRQKTAKRSLAALERSKVKRDGAP